MTASILCHKTFESQLENSGTLTETVHMIRKKSVLEANLYKGCRYIRTF